MAPPGNNRVFGQAMKTTKKKKYGSSNYQRQFGGAGKHQQHSRLPQQSQELSDEQVRAQQKAQRRRVRQAQGEQLDREFGYLPFNYKTATTSHETKRGWLFNMLPTTVSSVDSTNPDGDADPSTNEEESGGGGGSGGERSGLDLYFITPTGSTFKSTVLYDPYFYVVPDVSKWHTTTLPQQPQLDNTTDEEYAVLFETLTSMLMRLYESMGLLKVEIVYKQDLDIPNHLSPAILRRGGYPLLKLVFENVQQLTDVRMKLKTDIVDKNHQKAQDSPHEYDMTKLYPQSHHRPQDTPPNTQDPLSTLLELREYDVPYLVRVCTDLNIRAGAWYTVQPNAEDVGVRLSHQDAETKANPTFLAFDIECTKAPLKFPDASHDSIFMISYMVNGQGYLIISREVVSQDVQNFEYTPKPSYPGPFHIFNEPNEEALLRRFFDEYRSHKPQIVVTYNGDFFDWPFVEDRAKLYGLDIRRQLGVERIGDSEYRGRCSIHLDAFHWVQRDSYLPQGSQGLKAVTKYKLGYDPVEVDPEDMVRYAQEKPVHMATYSVSDAVATYYLYEKYVHLFIFSLCTIIPHGPEDVLRKGSGTLCEALLMVQACEKSIVCPNKQVDPLSKFHKGHLLESETYIGGKVECLETGVYRSDVEYKFDLQPKAFQGLIDNIDRDLSFAIEVEGGLDRTKITNYDEIRSQIVEELEMLRDRPNRIEKPYIYHLDVGAMYPNIILSNRLQPSAIVDDATCAACDYNQSKNDCKRKMKWVWRGDYTPATKNEYDRTKDQLSRENIQGEPFHTMDPKEQAGLVASRLKTYARNAYRKTKITEEETRVDTVCMRENDFYVETVRRFRDRRYELKKLTKVWKKKIGGATDAASKKEAEDKTLVYDSLQVAHKCILNSFYGYVMRKGARWRSMEMAGIVTKNGADLITQARILVEQIGRPLELDTDGIWCILPKSFPDVYNFKTSDGGKFKLEYPCIMLNADVHENFTNHQYQVAKDPKRGIYETRSDNSIFFEVDGPYRAMILPSSTEEGKLLKKRYAVFNFDGSLAELKGFELKRRGELELIKTFQSQIFERFLDGNSLKECYDSVAEVANHWIDVLDTHGESLETDELVDLISENRNMSRQLEDYGDQKGTSLTTARRLGEFLGAEIIKDKGLNCKFIIAEQPYGAPVTERAIPTAIWKSEPAVMKHFLRKWLKSPGMDDDDFDVRNILDWQYYTERLAKTIQKIITIPAALQKVPNPVPRVPHPDWLNSKVRQLNDPFKQKSIRNMFGVKSDSQKKSTAMVATTTTPKKALGDMEDFGMAGSTSNSKRPIVRMVKRTERRSIQKEEDESTTVQEVVQVEPEERVKLSKDSFNEWLQQRKSTWRGTRKEKRSRLREITDGSQSASANPTTLFGKKTKQAVSSMEGYIRDASLALAQNEWHVIEIRELSSLDARSARSSASGDFVLWVMVGGESLQKVHVTVPRTLYITAHRELKYDLGTGVILEMKRVEKHLPHGKNAPFVYEVKLAENAYKNKDWLKALKPANLAHEDDDDGHILDSVYETQTPLMLRVLMDIGCVSKINQSVSDGKTRKSYDLSDVHKVVRPDEREYLHRSMSYKRMFLYVSSNPRTKTGIVALFELDGGSGAREENEDAEGHDLTRPESSPAKTLRMSASCHVWIVKPGSSRGQKNLSLKQCESVYRQLLESIQELSAESEASGQTSEYSSISPASSCNVASLKFVDSDDRAFTGVNEALNSYAAKNHGPTFLLLNSSKPLQQLRRAIPGFNAFPVVTLPFPPGPAHNPSLSTLPALNWEPTAVQLCMEAFFYMGAVSYPKRVSYARYGQVPIGNLGRDETVTLYDVSFSRQLQKTRTVSWASNAPGKPDLGVTVLPSADGGDCNTFDVDAGLSNQNEIWGDDDELISPVIRNPGAFRCICADIDVHDLAIAALTETLSAPTTAPGYNNQMGGDGGSPTSVALFNNGFGGSDPIIKSSAPLGDEMSTAMSLPLLRAMANAWLRDAYDMNSIVADDMLHHAYRLISSPEPLMNDPALHRVIHSLMKASFLRLLGELQRLGCSIVSASFHKITVATNKSSLSDAEEYVNFVISTIRNRASPTSGNHMAAGLGKIALRPSNYYSNFIFLDEYNFGAIQLDRREIEEHEDIDWVLPNEEDEDGLPIVPTVVSGWNMMHYLGSEIAQEYFRLVIGRYSKDVLRKQCQLEERDEFKQVARSLEFQEQLLSYKRKLVSKHFASFLTRAVGEIEKEGGGPESFQRLPGSHLVLTNPSLEFIKSVMTVLELDPDVSKETSILKKSLLSQIGVQEYSSVAKWVNPCASFILPDVFCVECNDCRDINLCNLPSLEDDDSSSLKRHWECQDCGTPYNNEEMERRLIDIVNRKTIRYQLQDIRCTKTGGVATKIMAKQSDCSAPLQLDIPRNEAFSQLRIIDSLAEFHNLEWLHETTQNLLKQM